MSKKITQITMTIFLTAFVFISLAVTVNAEESKNWEFKLAPFYLWAVNMDGDMTLQGNTVPLTIDFDQIVDNLEGLFTVHFEGMHKSNWGFLADISYININDTQTSPGPTMNIDFTTVMTELAGVYQMNLGADSVDFFGGIRYYKLEAEIDVVGAPPRVDRLLQNRIGHKIFQV